MHPWVRFLVILLATSALLPAAGIRPGMTEREVTDALGQPSAELRRGERLILLYPQEGRVELHDGRVTAMARVPLEVLEADGVPAPANASPAPASPPVETGNAEPATAELADVIEGLDAGEESEAPPTFTAQWGGVLLAFVFKLLITVVVLKASFAWADVDADWAQMWLPALADGLVRTGIVAGAELLLNTSELFYLDEAIGYFVLLAVLLKKTHACTLPRAVAVAGAAKVASVVVWSLVSVVLLQLAFG